MKFEIRRTGIALAAVKVSEGGTTIDLGLLDREERIALALELRDAADELYPVTEA